MGKLSISLLGSFQVSLDGASISHFPYTKLRALLAYLAIESDRPHARETLAEMLWPDQPEEVARNNLRQSLSRLRKLIHEDLAASAHLLITHETVQFNLASHYDIDVAKFATLLTECE